MKLLHHFYSTIGIRPFDFNVHYRVFHTADWIVLVKDGNELWRVGCQSIDEIGFCTWDPDPVAWDYFFLMNANGRTHYLAVDPEWEGVDDIIDLKP